MQGQGSGMSAPRYTLIVGDFYIRYADLPRKGPNRTVTRSTIWPTTTTRSGRCRGSAGLGLIGGTWAPTAFDGLVRWRPISRPAGPGFRSRGAGPDARGDGIRRGGVLGKPAEGDDPAAPARGPGVRTRSDRHSCQLTRCERRGLPATNLILVTPLTCCPGVRPAGTRRRCLTWLVKQIPPGRWR